MFLVEYTKICENKLKRCCSCFYHMYEACIFRDKLIDDFNVKSIKISEVEFSTSEILYEKDVNNYAK